MWWRCPLISVALATLTSAACTGVLRPASAYERYLDTLRSSRLTESALGRDWIRVGEEALARPVMAQTPFRESAYFPPDTPSAVAYRLTLERGRRLAFDVSFDTSLPGRLFVDLFRLPAEGAPDRVASLADGTTALTYDIDRDGDYLLRVQPELLRGGRWTVVSRTLASLAFPIAGSDARAIQSRFGAVRDAGARQHEGVDIFVPRGTPVVAVATGSARADTNALGGNVVWLRGDDGGRYYYAHLDRWAIDGTVRVAAGDVVGYAGNTGNARTTAPHLHFGIYDRGAIDPSPFLRMDEERPGPVTGSLDALGTLVRVSSARVTLRAGAHGDAGTVRQLERGTLARVSGLVASSLRVLLPDRTVGYVPRQSVGPADAATARILLAAGTTLLESPSDRAPVVHSVVEPTRVDRLGVFDGFEYVRADERVSGWIRPRG